LGKAQWVVHVVTSYPRERTVVVLYETGGRFPVRSPFTHTSPSGHQQEASTDVSYGPSTVCGIAIPHAETRILVAFSIALPIKRFAWYPWMTSRKGQTLARSPPPMHDGLTRYGAPLLDPDVQPEMFSWLLSLRQARVRSLAYERDDEGATGSQRGCEQETWIYSPQLMQEYSNNGWVHCNHKPYGHLLPCAIKPARPYSIGFFAVCASTVCASTDTNR